MSNLYHRELLTDINATKVVETIDQAIVWLDSSHTTVDDLRNALRARLNIRKALLSATDFEEGLGDFRRPDSWTLCFQMMHTLRSTANLGVSVASAFSPKIQRRLASTVPPRPVVNIAFDDACAFLERTCIYAWEGFGILRCSGASHLIVWLCMVRTVG